MGKRTRTSTGRAGRLADRVYGLDVRAFRAVCALRRGWLTPVMRAFTLLGAAGAVWGALAAAAFVFGGFYLPGLLVSWAAIAGAWILAEASKHLFDRARPSGMAVAPLVKTPSSSSFPSGHSATAAAGAVSLSAANPAFAPLLAAGGLAVMLSRVYLGVHYPSDVLAGAVIGGTCAVLLAPLA